MASSDDAVTALCHAETSRIDFVPPSADRTDSPAVSGQTRAARGTSRRTGALGQREAIQASSWSPSRASTEARAVHSEIGMEGRAHAVHRKARRLGWPTCTRAASSGVTCRRDGLITAGSRGKDQDIPRPRHAHSSRRRSSSCAAAAPAYSAVAWKRSRYSQRLADSAASGSSAGSAITLPATAQRAGRAGRSAQERA
jgi:hypothetical protein